MFHFVLKYTLLAVLALATLVPGTNAQTSLISTGAVWKYLDDGTDPGVAWSGTGFTDGSWFEGPAELGYGDTVDGRPEATVVGFGPDAANKFITTYFRHSFTVADAGAYTNLLLRLMRDDGAVVYLNGAEVYRSNMPTGAVTHLTLALSAAADDGATFIPKALSSSLLVSGVNVVAVEMHQSVSNSSDLSFALSLEANYVPAAPDIVITSPTNTAMLASAIVSVVASATDSDGEVTLVEFFEGANKLGEDTNAPFSFAWSGMPTGAYVLRAVATDLTGLRGTSAPVSITLITPPPTVVQRGSSWKYLDTGVDQGTAWTALDFNDAAWPSGLAELGYGDGDEVTTLLFGPDTNNKFVTYYFRQKFVVNTPSAYGSLLMTLRRDDGAVVYINGVEVFRIALPDGPLTFATLATTAADQADDVAVLPSSVLVAGTNIIAVEIHQGNVTSSDISMDLEILGNLSPSVVLTAPADGATFGLPTTIGLSALALDGDGAVTKVEFYEGVNKLGEDNTPPFTFSWANAADAVYQLTAVATDNNGGTSTSAPVAITVTDTNLPVITQVTGSTNQLTIQFSKRVSPATATNLANYSINNGVADTLATLGGFDRTVILNTSYIQPGVNRILTVSGVQDAAGRTMVATNITFSVFDYTVTDIGSAVPATFANLGDGAFTMTAAGTNVLGTTDQFSLSSVQRSDDFDVKVRVAGLGLTDPWAKAGLMARETTAAGSRYAASFATPSISGCFFQSRSALNGVTTTTGSFPINYPYTWLRLRRVGDVFTGFASLDGNNWQQLGTVTLATAPRPMLVGFAVSSGLAAQPTIVEFRDSMPVVGGTIGSVVLPVEPPGPSTRNGGLTISEIMYHPKGTNALEFIEIFNAKQFIENMGGYRISGDVDYTFPAGTVIQPGGFLVVARNPSALQSAYSNSIAGVLGPWENSSNSTNAGTLPDDTGTLRLRNSGGAVIVEVTYEGDLPWPIAADGAGHSLVLARPSYGTASPKAWAASDLIGGSPGRWDGVTFDPIRSVVINEFLAHTDLPDVDFIELYNTSLQPVRLDGCYLSDDRDTNKFRIPNNTTIPARGFVSFPQTQLGFALSSTGERIYLVNSNQNRVIDAHLFEATANGVSSGRSPDGTPGFHELAATTPGTTNAGLLLRDIVINEIMFNPISDNDDDEFVELHNRGASAADVGRWSFTAGLNYVIPPGTVIPAGGYLVIARNAARLRGNYSQLNTTNTIGDYDGQLGNSGERLALGMPDYNVTTNGSILVTNINYIVVDEVTYGEGGRWGNWADGGGSSLELVDPRSDNRQASSWEDSDTPADVPWSLVQDTQILDNGKDTINEVQLFLLGAGECLVDDVSISQPGQANAVANGNFESGLTGWFLGGNHIRSTLEDTGFNSSRSLHLRATGGGDNGANRVEKDMTTTYAAGGTATIGCRARWLRGHPDLLIRVHGGHIETVGTLPVPKNLGTPGQVNSRFRANGAPAIWDVAHSPILPAASERVLVSARVHDPDGLGGVQLRYRLDPATTFTTVAMVSDGAGFYTNSIPGQAANALVAFHVVARDGVLPAATNLFPNDAPGRECHVRFGEVNLFGNLGTYRFWMTASNINHWAAREKLSNEALDTTFVYGNFRVIYNGGGRYRGSPFLRPGYSTPTTGSPAFVWTMPDDDLFLGTDELNMDSLEPTGRDSTLMREPTSFTMAEQMGFSFSYQRYVHVVINGIADNTHGVPAYADVQQPNSDYFTSWYPGADDGDVFKVDDWFEFDDAVTGPASQGNTDATLSNWTTTSGGVVIKDKARYRNNWEKKTNKGLNDDYTGIYALADAMNVPTASASYVSAIESVWNIEQVMTWFALRHTIGDWDGYGYNRGKNTFIYRAPGGRFDMIPWDLDFSLGCSGGHGPTEGLFGSVDGLVGNLYNHPHFRRIFFRAFQRIVDGPLLPANYAPLLDARFRSLQANGVVTVSPYVPSGAQNISIPDWILARRNYLITQIPTATFAVAGGNSVTNTTNQITFTGTAPVNIKTILINGAEYPITWTTPTAWTVRVPMNQASNQIVFQGYDALGNPIAGTARTNTAYFTGTAPAPENFIVINEIMFNPLMPDAEYVELFNTSSNYTFDLSGWRFNGIDYTFPAGSIIAPRGYVVVAKDCVAFVAAFGPNSRILGPFAGNLQEGGETITLIKPGATPAQDVVIDKVRYEDNAPWPLGTNEIKTAASIQLIDATQDNSRPANWLTRYVPPTYSPAVDFPGATNDGWRQVTLIGTNQGVYPPTGATNSPGTNFLIYLSPAPGGELYIDDMVLVAGTVPGAGPNLLQNGDFEAPMAGTWGSFGNHSNSTISTTFSRTGSGSLRVLATGVGGASANVKQIIPRFLSNQVCTLTFWFYSTFTANNLTVRTTPGSGFNFTTNINPQVIPPSYTGPQLISAGVTAVTPGTNNTGAASLVPIPNLWINEVQTINGNGIVDNTGQRGPWIELYNASTNVVPLAGLFLADNYTNVAQWAFPDGASLNPGEFKVIFTDGHPERTTPSEWHTSFLLPPTAGSIALTRVTTRPEVLDYIEYSGARANFSYGSFPDGQPFTRQEFYFVTPAGTNDASARPVQVFVNEWMASNAGFLVDTNDNTTPDWFELYNAGDTAADLSDFYLTDTLANKTMFQIPRGVIIPAGGYMLFYADEDHNTQNSPGGEVHVNFRLGGNGDAIGLYSPQGALVDAYTFGRQTNNISQGRYLDGTTNIFWMPIPTPRAANIVPGLNAPPTLAAIDDKTVTFGQTLTFTALGSDSDMPSQLLTYSLPASVGTASIGAGSGIFTWTPGAEHTPGTHVFTVRVTDNGAPQLSAERTFVVSVVPPPVITVSSMINGVVSLTFPTVAGKLYRVEYTGSLTSPIDWQILTPPGDNVLATGSSLTIEDMPGEAGQRFYRVYLVN